ncbi:hypothetical protein [Microbulbifer variabilis]|uniref:hypothetical protein n=1 Tax=Microbulbifer variabilis TaxID=266805 RepID=UPI000370B551|nr:hypothetical protein [Microbulbifer variabilis]
MNEFSQLLQITQDLDGHSRNPAVTNKRHARADSRSMKLPKVSPQNKLWITRRQREKGKTIRNHFIGQVHQSVSL